ncbi:hypothetical protein E2562_012587 [Oryza meyeriana var. granulata]|uniref:Uncharacterized protein n=1 Tax=Oryza meyeriana var. granulata TaxID=110450 RepID=A0A6G1D386_9ORYZ|nr:hypothetical protein E2562_012587 [Oryza meyeriana var. granulata]
MASGSWGWQERLSSWVHEDKNTRASYSCRETVAKDLLNAAKHRIATSKLHERWICGKRWLELTSGGGVSEAKTWPIEANLEEGAPAIVEAWRSNPRQVPQGSRGEKGRGMGGEWTAFVDPRGWGKACGALGSSGGLRRLSSGLPGQRLKAIPIGGPRPHLSAMWRRANESGRQAGWDRGKGAS